MPVPGQVDDQKMKVPFEDFIYKFDRWLGDIEFLMPCSGSTNLQISMRGDSSGITDKQKEDVNQFIANYQQLWSVIAKEIEKVQPDGDFELHPKITLALQGLVGCDNGLSTFDYIVGYQAYRDNAFLHSFMACIDNMQVSEIIIVS